MTRRYLKQQRKKRQGHKRQVQQNQKAQIKSRKAFQRPVPWKPVKMKLFSMNNPFPPTLSREDRIRIGQEIGQTASEKFHQKFPQLEKWFEEFDALYILSTCSFYFLSHPDGIDPEIEGKMEFAHYHLEVLQAFALMKERNNSVKPLLNKGIELKKEMQEIGRLNALRGLAAINPGADEKEIARDRLLSEMRIQTCSIRNWAYHDQTIRVSTTLMRRIAPDFESLFGVDPEKLVSILNKMVGKINDRLSVHLTKLFSFYKKKDYRQMMLAYNLAFPETTPFTDDGMEEIFNLAHRQIKQLRTFLLTHADLRLEKIYTFDLEEITDMYGEIEQRENLKSLFKKWSIGFGDLEGSNPEHFLLANPVWDRPLIKINEKSYFTSVLGTLPHILLAMLEGIIVSDPKLKEKYEKVRSMYLEEEVKQLLEANFPNGQVFAGSMWKDPLSGKEYENDLLLLLDTFLFVIECKSGAVDPPAKRGAPNNLKEVFEKLVLDPADQANRFIAYLKDHVGEHRFETKRNTINIFSTFQVCYYLRFTVTFENLGMFGGSLRPGVEAGFLPDDINSFSPTICFTDLESIFRLLDLEVEKVHYLVRRSEFEAHMQYYGDELDLVAFYLDTGFNIGDSEFDKDIMINLGMKSKELDPYFLSVEQGVNVKKPELALTKWWKDILSGLSSRRPSHWVETGFILLSMAKEDQIEFERKMEKLKLKLKSEKTQHKYNWVALAFGPAQRRLLIAGFPYKNLSREERNQVMRDILYSKEAEGTKGSVCIGIDIAANEYPYSGLASSETNALGGALTS